MTKRIKVGDVYLEVAHDPSARPRQVIAEKAQTPDSIEPVAFSNAAPDSISQYIAQTTGTEQSARTQRPADIALDRMTAWQAFAGAKSTHPQQWLRYLEGSARHCGFNQWAFLFGAQWFVFNRMYAAALVASVLDLGTGLLGFELYSRAGDALNTSRSAVAMQLLALLVGFGLPRLAVGSWANIALFRRAQREIAKIDGFDVDNSRKLSMIASAGAGSFGALFVLYLAAFVLRLLSSAST